MGETETEILSAITITVISDEFIPWPHTKHFCFVSSLLTGVLAMQAPWSWGM